MPRQMAPGVSSHCGTFNTWLDATPEGAGDHSQEAAGLLLAVALVWWCGRAG
jgi:hypothetical protein